MENRDEKKKPLYISSNVLERKDMIEGFGSKEVGYIGISTAIAIVLFFIVYGVFGDILIGFVIAVFIIGGVIFTVRKDQYNESFIDKIHLTWEFGKTQKRYEYQFKDCLYPKMKDAWEEKDEK